MLFQAFELPSTQRLAAHLARPVKPLSPIWPITFLFPPIKSQSPGVAVAVLQCSVPPLIRIETTLPLAPHRKFAGLESSLHFFSTVTAADTTRRIRRICVFSRVIFLLDYSLCLFGRDSLVFLNILFDKGSLGRVECAQSLPHAMFQYSMKVG